MEKRKLNKKQTAAAALAVLALVLLLGWLLFLRPYLGAETAMPQDAPMELLDREDGSLLLTWPEAAGADAYVLEIRAGDGGEATPVTVPCDGPSCQIPGEADLSQGAALTVYAVKNYRTVLGEKQRRGGTPLTASWSGERLRAGGVSAEADPDTAALTLTWKGEADARYSLLTDDGRTLWEGEAVSSAVLTFGDGGDLPALTKGESVTLRLCACREEEGLIYRDMAGEAVEVSGEDFQSTVLHLEMEEQGENIYTFTWNQTRGERYELQQKTDDGQWRTLETFTDDDSLTYTTAPLDAYTRCTFRVAALGGHTLPDSEFAAEPDEVSFTTGAKVLYDTIWVLQDQNIYADAARSRVVGRAVTGASYCVMGEERGMFLIYFDGGKGYVDSNYCLINLPDYLGPLCAYDIPNSYGAIYKVHGAGIPGVTNTVITGYEQVASSGSGPSRYLVPLLYPTAKKVAAAARAAQAAGCRLKIYDAYRPYAATRFLYDQTQTILDQPVPGQPETDGEQPMTYYSLMTNDTYSLGSFLARSGSRHNQGVAVDLTLETLEGGKELGMQTAMHDLSWYSIVAQNNANAKLLAGIMTGSGLAPLSTEWWHFQDDELRARVTDLAMRKEGVTRAGWTFDGAGWRYRRTNGQFFTGGSYTISGRTYAFDADGYADYAAWEHED